MVAFTSGAVLTLEIVSLRLVAPYVGLTLETSTAVIGFALAAIAAGAWVGGQLADRFPPRRFLGPAVLTAGVMVLVVGPVVRWTAEAVPSGDIFTVLAVAGIAVFPPAAVLSSVTPMVVKLRLTALAETGSVVGSMSGVATLGALVATFVTGFVLVAAIPTSRILLALGVCLVIVGGVLAIRHHAFTATSVVAVAFAGIIAAVAPGAPCDVETAYHCARILVDEDRPGGRRLQLDTLSHSYVDLDDPEHLEFSYIRAFASVIDVMRPDEDLRSLHLGGGALTFPRYLQATRSAATDLVVEIDRGVVALDRQRLGATFDSALQVRIDDARVALASEQTDSRDVVVGDAFSGLSVPWHLTTREAIAEVRRILGARGVYLVNLIDYPPLGFVRAEAATIRDVFPRIGVIARPEVLDGRSGGNVVIVASQRDLPAEQLSGSLKERVPELVLMSDRSELDAFIGDAQVLVDDYAPVDRLLTAIPGWGY